MRVLAICLIVLMLGLAHNPARADDAASISASDRQAIEQVIKSQLDAFRRDAGDAAFGAASPNIQSMFGNATHFMAMVQQGYPPVYRSRSAEFEQVQTIDDRIVQRVMLIGPDGAAVTALYTMEHEPDGTWKIDGCTLTKPSGIST